VRKLVPELVAEELNGYAGSNAYIATEAPERAEGAPQVTEGILAMGKAEGFRRCSVCRIEKPASEFRRATMCTRRATGGVVVGCPCGPLSVHVLDDLDQLVGAVTVAAGVVDELSCSLDDGASLGCSCDGDARPCRNSSNPSSRTRRSETQHRVGVHADQDGREVIAIPPPARPPTQTVCRPHTLPTVTS
jgi:hypothetical protein